MIIGNGRLCRLPRNIWILTGGSLLTDVSSEMIVHLIPLFLANVLGAPTLAIGFIEGAAETIASLLKAVSGRLSDRIGRRKWLTVAGYVLSTLAKPFLAGAGSWPAVFGVRFVDRVGKGMRTAPRDALIADSIAPSQRGLAFGLHRAGDTFGAAIGLLAALLVVWLAQGERLTLQPATFRLLVWLSVIPAGLAVLLLATGIKETASGLPPGKNASPLSRRDLGRPYRRFLLIVTLFTLGNSADAFLVLRAQERGLSVLGTLALLVGFNLVYALVSGPASALSDKIGRRRFLIAGWLLYAALYAGFALAQTAGQIGLLFVLYGVYYGLTEGSAKALVADLVRPQQRGAAYGYFNAAIGVTALPASLLAGLLWQGAGGWSGWGAPAPFALGAALALAATLLLSIWKLES